MKEQLVAQIKGSMSEVQNNLRDIKEEQVKIETIG